MIAIIGAMESEIVFYKKNIKNINIKNIFNHEFFIGTIGNVDVVVVKCGIGKVSSSIVTSLVINEFNPKLIINTGIAGGTDPLTTGSIFIANKYVYGDFDLTIFNYPKGQVPGCDHYFVVDNNYNNLFKQYLNDNKLKFNEGLIVTQDSFITKLSQLDAFEKYNVATDMEGASMAHTCQKYNIPFFSIRIISDIIESNSQVENYDIFEEQAAMLSSKITFEFLSSL